MATMRKLPILAALLLTSLACNTVTDFVDEFRTPVVLPTINFPSETEEPSESGEPTSTFVAPENPNPGAEGIGDPYFDELGNGGYDVQHYDIALDVDMDANVIEGVTTIDAVTTQDLTSLNMELLGLNVDYVAVGGVSAPFERNRGEMTIYLPEPVAANQLIEISVAYHGTPGEDESGAVAEYSEGWYHYGHGIYVAGEPTGASTWYPVNEHPLDKATYSYAITVDADLEVAANGYLQRIEENGDKSTHYWIMEDPIGPYMTTIGIAQFEVEEYQGPTGLPIRNYFGAGVSRSVREDFALQGEMVAYFETVFGPYPFQAYGVVVHDLDLGFALETATMSVFGDGFTDEYVVSHELAHMWFGDHVGLKGWQHIWLNEGFATYASELWNEHAYGREMLDANIEANYQYVAMFGDFMTTTPIGDPGPDQLFNEAVYVRGSLVLHALRLEVGDGDFFEILRTYVERFGGGNAETADFIGVAEDVSGEDLGGFFDAWLFQTELPPIPQMGLSSDDFSD
jgi:aminopeptidase N